MEHAIKLNYGSQLCEDILNVVLEKGLNSAWIQTPDGEIVSLVIKETGAVFLQSGVTASIKEGDSLFLVYRQIQVMSHLSALAQLTHILFHCDKLGHDK